MSAAYKAPSSLEGRAFTILGAGTLGRRIALMWLTQGGIVHLYDSNPKQLDAAKAYIDGALPQVLADIVQTGKAGTLKLFTKREEALESSWIVVEAVPEILDLKIDLLGDLDSILPLDVILATNSSSYTPTEIGTKVIHQDRLISTHYYMPPTSLPVEIMPTTKTSKDIAPLIYKEAARHGLKPFHVKKESVGLIANRIWAAIKRECLYTAAQGIAEPSEIDELLQLAIGFRSGPFQNMDRVGLDVVADIEHHYQQTRPGQCPPEATEYLSTFVKEGKLGVKTGEGFYKHPKDAPHAATDQLLFLDIVSGEIQSITTTGKQQKTLVSGLFNLPDGVQIDSRPGKAHIYWTAMGRPSKQNNGTVWRADLDGKNVTNLVAEGLTHTPKQLVLDAEGERLYWCDREGGRIQRCRLDGSKLETLYDSAPGQQRPLLNGRDWCVGIALDTKRGLLYWTQKGASKGSQGRILRSNIEIPKGQTESTRKDIQTLFDRLPEPIDLEIDGKSQTLYWTDRGDPPFGNSLNKFNVSSALDPKGEAAGPSAKLTLSSHFHETIGLTLDVEKGIAYVSDLLGSIWSCDLETGNKKVIVRDRGNYTGITLVKRGSSSSNDDTARKARL